MRYAFFLMILLFFVSCNTDDDNDAVVQSPEEVGFFNLRVGNTWNYEYFRREVANDASSDFISTGTTEVREIIERESINNEVVYTVQVTSSFGDNDFSSEFDEEIATYQVKDSLGYLVRLDQGIIFSSIDTEDYLIGSLSFGDVFGVLLEGIETVETPAGAFDCLVNELFAVLNDGELSPGRSSLLITEEVGEVLQRISLVNDPLHIAERRLTSFDFPQ